MQALHTNSPANVLEPHISQRDRIETYRRYAPAYSYGWREHLRRGAVDWDECVNDLARGWNQVVNGEALTWDEAYGAVRAGWDHICPGRA